MFKKIFISISILMLNFTFSFAARDTTIENGLKNLTNEETVISGVDQGGLNTVDKIINYFQDTTSSLVLLLALAVFIYIGLQLVFARGNPEEFKKYMLHFTYAAVGFFVIAASWAIVKLVAGLNI